MNEENGIEVPSSDILRMSVDIVASYVGAHKISSQQIPEIINTVFGTLNNVNEDKIGKKKKPAVSIGRSIKPDYIICLEDGTKLKMLKRHLRTSFGLTPDQYRAKWKLPPDYPMVAPNYSKRRSDFAKKIKLGQQPVKKNRAV